MTADAITWLQIATQAHRGDRARYGDDWPDPATDEAVLGHLIQEWAFESFSSAHDGAHIVAVFVAALHAANEDEFADAMQHNWRQLQRTREEE